MRPRCISPATARLLKDLVEKMEGIQVFNVESLEKVYNEFSEEAKIQPGQIIHPTRLAISGISFGPGLFELMAVLGNEIVVRRIKKAIAFIEDSIV